MNRTEKIILGLILLLFAVMSCVGISWGLPSRDIDKYLFGDQKPWSGEKIYRLAVADGDEKFSPRLGADVDVDPLDKQSDEPILLTGTDEDIAKIYLRYRLYTYQPDEMITMMALSGMRPSEFKFDPRLYQYGGLFIYPVGVLIKICGLLGLIDVRSDIVYYLDNPDEFGKFYIVARAYSALWGLIGVFTVFAITRRLDHSYRGAMDKLRLSMNNSTSQHGQTSLTVAPNLETPTASSTSRAGLLAALLFTCMPVVVCMAHEGKPHLPGAVLMLLAVYFAMRYLGIQTPHYRSAGGMKSRYIGSLRGDTVANHAHANVGMPPTNPSLERERRVSHVNSKTLAGKPPVAPDDPNRACQETAKHARASLGHGTQIDWWLMCICCGAAFGMVLSSGPILILIPLVAYLSTKCFPNRVEFPNRDREGAANLAPPLTKGGQGGVEQHAHASVGMPPDLLNTFTKTVVGVIVGFAVYFVTNPYVLINTFVNREVLQSNFGNSFAMYEIAKIGQGFVRVLELTVEGATLPILILGAIALVLAIKQKRFSILPLAIPALLFFAQFVLIGAGKPAEYGRFGIFPNVALAIGASCILSIRWTKRREILNWIPASFVIVVLFVFGGLYLVNFYIDTTEMSSRIRARCGPEMYARIQVPEDRMWNWWLVNKTIGVIAEPAPYCCPPLPFDNIELYLTNDVELTHSYSPGDLQVSWLIRTVDQTHLRRMGYKSSPGIQMQKYLNVNLAKFFDIPTSISWANKPIEMISKANAAAP